VVKRYGGGARGRTYGYILQCIVPAAREYGIGRAAEGEVRAGIKSSGIVENGVAFGVTRVDGNGTVEGSNTGAGAGKLEFRGGRIVQAGRKRSFEYVGAGKINEVGKGGCAVCVNGNRPLKTLFP
jgi:hypothetical protein